MQPIPYLFFKDTCAAAMRHYGEVLGAEPEIMSLASAPEEVRAAMPGASPDGVMHSALKVGDGWIYASDDLSGDEVDRMAGVSISLSFPTEAETRRVYDALADGGEARMPLAPLFFSPLFGALTDRFGIRWMIMQDGPEG